ncbi:hypothetical protein Tco_0804207 [Tanacetum coccineum]|uniref:Uncharacterized protein n=1 Tax=Tanacetum coccineum TaxID=301880 RepID=A0ABQ5A3P9_9ASTR
MQVHMKLLTMAGYNKNIIDAGVRKRWMYLHKTALYCHYGFYSSIVAKSESNSSYNDEGAMADFTNLETVVNVSPIPTSRIHSSYPSTLILGDQLSSSNRSKGK